MAVNPLHRVGGGRRQCARKHSIQGDALTVKTLRASTEMYLKHTGSGQVVLVSSRIRRKLAILHVTDPAEIRTVEQVSIDAPSPYAFVQDLGYSAVTYSLPQSLEICGH